jgi:prolyl-tRNA editing enzyme YbaK/EbsC (Cys-tRNA(Pro) deacylase)
VRLEDALARPAVRRVVAALTAAGLEDRVRALADTARTADDAARALGVPVGAIVKSLAFAAADGIVLACVAGDRRCDVAALGRVLGLRSNPARARPDAVKVATGFTIGGVAPVGHATALPLALDESLGRFETVYAAAGHPHCVFATTLDELARLTGGIVDGHLAPPTEPLD